MGNIISEGLEYIGRIDDNGYVYDRSGKRIAKIDDSGYIVKDTFEGGIYGKIDEDGTIRDASLCAVGRIEADGYVYIHSNRICKVSSSFVEKITPKAWNSGEPSSYSGRSKEGINLPSFDWPFGFGTTVKLIIGVILGIWCIIEVGGNLGFLGCLLAIPFSIAFVFILCFIIKLFNG